MQTNTCAAASCSRSIDSTRLMCGHHWRLVPQAQQQVVWRTWRATQSAKPEDAAERWLAYMVARKAAIDQVKQAEAGTSACGQPR